TAPPGIMTATKALTPIDWLIDPPPARVDPAVEAATKSNSIESATAISRAAAPPADTATPMTAPAPYIIIEMPVHAENRHSLNRFLLQEWISDRERDCGEDDDRKLRSLLLRPVPVSPVIRRSAVMALVLLQRSPRAAR